MCGRYASTAVWVRVRNRRGAELVTGRVDLTGCRLDYPSTLAAVTGLVLCLQEPKQSNHSLELPRDPRQMPAQMPISPQGQQVEENPSPASLREPGLGWRFHRGIPKLGMCHRPMRNHGMFGLITDHVRIQDQTP